MYNLFINLSKSGSELLLIKQEQQRRVVAPKKDTQRNPLFLGRNNFHACVLKNENKNINGHTQ